MTTVPLNETAIATVNGAGNATASVGPLSARESWNPATVHVSVSSSVLESECVIYAGDRPIPSNFRDQTVNGSSGDSTDRVSADKIGCGHKIIAVWSGANVGAIATLVVTGTKDI
jgi:hypothetical protein